MDFDYQNMVFVLVKPPAKVISTHRLKDKSQYLDLLVKARDKKCLIYYSDIVKIKGKYCARDPITIDVQSLGNIDLSDQAETVVSYASEAPTSHSAEVADMSLKCPYCGKTMSSTSGKTLHIKHKHPEQIGK
jgi:aspartate carbamoyltransferase regulatory subunit